MPGEKETQTGTNMTASQDLNPKPGGWQFLGLNSLQWLICFIAVIGFTFDTYSLLMAQFVLPPAVREFLPKGVKPGSEQFKAFVGQWKGLMFFLPALVGGFFGLIGGYLTDRLGRRRVLTWSILIYAVSAFLSGFSTSIAMLLVLRCFTFMGVCVEFVAAIAWLAEMFPVPETRERVLGYTQAFSSFGGIMVAGVYFLTNKSSGSMPTLHIPSFLTGFFGDIPDAHRHEAWRYTLISGLIPAIPLIIIRPFLPESPVCRTFLSEARPHHDHHDDHVRVQLWGGVRRHPTNAGRGPGVGRRAGKSRRGQGGFARTSRSAGQGEARPGHHPNRCSRCRRIAPQSFGAGHFAVHG
jgi:MFS family permease